MNKEQEEQLKGWGIDPKTIKESSSDNPKTIEEPKSNNVWKVFAIILAILFTATVVLYVEILKEEPVIHCQQRQEIETKHQITSRIAKPAGAWITLASRQTPATNKKLRMV